MTHLSDLRDEFYSKSLRRLIVLTELMKRKKFASGVTLRNLLMADLLICNPELLRRFLASFGQPQQSLRIDEVLYNDNVALGSADDTRDCAYTMIFLEKIGVVKFKLAAGTPTFESLWAGEFDTPLIHQWTNDLNEIIPHFVARSESVLYEHLIGVA